MSSSDDDENVFDAIIVGTGLAESILAAALSKAKYKVAHIDPNPYYGGDEASLSHDELLKWGEDVSAGAHAMYNSYSGTVNTLPFSRQYSICLKPSVIPALGPLITALIASGVSKYTGFKLLDSVCIYSQDGTVKNVPGSKDAIFTSDISLIEKRRLMRFLTFAGGEFERSKEIQGKEDTSFQEFLKTEFRLGDDTVAVIAYALAHCVSTSDASLPSLLRLREYLHSIGRYGPSPFLVGHYGGIGDIAQGFCRAAAVNGGVYVLGKTIKSCTMALPEGDKEAPLLEVQLDDFPEVLKAQVVISSRQNAPKEAPVSTHNVPLPPATSSTSAISRLTRCIAILDTPLLFSGPPSSVSEASDPPPASSRAIPDSAILIIPPATLVGGSSNTAATVFINGENSLSTPKGRWIVYITLPLNDNASTSSAQDVLKPYLDAVLKLTQVEGSPPTEPLSTSYFFENQTQSTTAEIEGASDDIPRYFVTPSIPFSTFPDLPDNATRIAEAAFHKIVCSLRSLQGQADEEIDFWPPIPAEDHDSDEED